MKYYMVDKVTELVRGKKACGVKAVSYDSDVLHDHFPEYPVLPGTFIVESMAQLSGFLIEMSCNTKDLIRRALLIKIEEAKFYSMAEPGDCIALEAKMGEQMKDAAMTTVVAVVGSRKIARATLTFVLKDIPIPAIHEQRRMIYRVWTRNCPNIPEIL
ncbi:MAG: 3-hydroxyacyl-ACP dehydratase FabZ family protein [bacterium]